MEKKNTLWYIRKNGTIKGPFTSTVIMNDLILGRLSMQDEVSHDQISWHILLHQTELHSHLSGSDLEKAKIHLDERNGFDQRHDNTNNAQNTRLRKKDRRSPENEIYIQRRQLHTRLMLKFRQQHQHLFWPLIVIFLALIIMALFAILSPKQLPRPLADCSSVASPQVNWSNCLKPRLNLQDKDLAEALLTNGQFVGSNFSHSSFIRANLSYADLSSSNLSYTQLQNANLMGAKLNNSDLRHANLTDANLSYANLSGAILADSTLNNTRFDHAIWVTGQHCAPQSIGECIFSGN